MTKRPTCRTLRAELEAFRAKLEAALHRGHRILS